MSRDSRQQDSRRSRPPAAQPSHAEEPQVSDEDDHEICALCQQQMTDPAVLVPCGHRFDHHCFRCWLDSCTDPERFYHLAGEVHSENMRTRGFTCPMCSTRLSGIEHTFRTNNGGFLRYPIDFASDQPARLPIRLRGLEVPEVPQGPAPIQNFDLQHALRESRIRSRAFYSLRTATEFVASRRSEMRGEEARSLEQLSGIDEDGPSEPQRSMQVPPPPPPAVLTFDPPAPRVPADGEPQDSNHGSSNADDDEIHS